MPLKIECKWVYTREGFCVACFAVSNDRNELLMYDEDLYYSFGKFLDHIVKTFIKNKRFKWDRAVFCEAKNELTIYGKDLKKV